MGLELPGYFPVAEDARVPVPDPTTGTKTPDQGADQDPGSDTRHGDKDTHETNGVGVKRSMSDTDITKKTSPQAKRLHLDAGGQGALADLRTSPGHVEVHGQRSAVGGGHPLLRSPPPMQRVVEFVGAKRSPPKTINLTSESQTGDKTQTSVNATRDRAPAVQIQTRDKSPAVQIQTRDKSPAVQIQTRDKSPAVQIQTRDKSPAVQIQTRDKSPAVQIQTRDKSPAVQIQTRDKSPAVQIQTRDKSPAVQIQTRDKSPAVQIQTRDRSPAVQIQTRDRSPAVKIQTRDRSPAVQIQTRDRSPAVQIQTRDKSPAVKIQTRDKSPAVQIQTRDRSPAVQIQTRDKSPTVQIQTRDRSPAVQIQMRDKSPAVQIQMRDKSPAVQIQTRDKSPAVQIQMRDKSPAVQIQTRDKSPAVQIQMRDKSPAVQIQAISVPTTRDKSPAVKIQTASVPATAKLTLSASVAGSELPSQPMDLDPDILAAIAQSGIRGPFRLQLPANLTLPTSGSGQKFKFSVMTKTEAAKLGLMSSTAGTMPTSQPQVATSQSMKTQSPMRMTAPPCHHIGTKVLPSSAVITLPSPQSADPSDSSEKHPPGGASKSTARRKSTREKHGKNDDSVPQLDGAADDCADGATVDKESRQNVFGSDYRSKVYCDKTDVSCMNDPGSCLDGYASDDSFSGDIAMIAQLDGNADGKSDDKSVTTQSGDVTTQSDDVTTQSRDVIKQSGDVTTQSGDVNTQSGDVTTQSGDVNTQSDDITAKSTRHEDTEGIIRKGAEKAMEENKDGVPSRPRHPAFKRTSGVPPHKGYVTITLKGHCIEFGVV